ncbi:hypothetical protein MKEN_01354700 [Mycena kentingensis (nom. inval.)]|nr:hypothetical protein MKEN_01354700 [Mycena kentingensis (nom. inval.)]
MANASGASQYDRDSDFAWRIGSKVPGLHTLVRASPSQHPQSGAGNDLPNLPSWNMPILQRSGTDVKAYIVASREQEPISVDYHALQEFPLHHLRVTFSKRMAVSDNFAEHPLRYKFTVQCHWTYSDTLDTPAVCAKYDMIFVPARTAISEEGPIGKFELRRRRNPPPDILCGWSIIPASADVSMTHHISPMYQEELETWTEFGVIWEMVSLYWPLLLRPPPVPFDAGQPSSPDSSGISAQNIASCRIAARPDGSSVLQPYLFVARKEGDPNIPSGGLSSETRELAIS